MRIVLDLQGAQSHSRLRGIGRYTLSMAKAFAAEAADHELWLMLNGCQDESSASLLAQFAGLIPRERIVVNALPSGIAGCHPQNHQRMHLAAAAQATLLAGLRADCIWHSSMFEGWGDDSIVTLGDGGEDGRHVATLYDLIPLLNPAHHLHDAGYRQWYYRRLGLLKRCGLLLAISESSRREASDWLQVPDDAIAVISGAADPVFRPIPLDPACRDEWRQRWQLQSAFVLYVGGYDAHKNVETLVAAFAELPGGVREPYQLVLAGRCSESAQKRLRQAGRKHRLAEHQLVFTGSLADTELARLYSACTVFVAPSLHEGLGLPALEAMACGAAVIGSNTSSLPEVIGRTDALFDPRSRSSIAAKLHEALADGGFLASLREHAAIQVRRFTWPLSARQAWAAIEGHVGANRAGQRRVPVRPRLLYVSPLPPVRSGIADYSARLLRELACHYDIDVVIDQPELVDPWVSANFPIRSLPWFMAHAGAVERILYHFGNAPFHAHMFGMLQQHSGVVMLHDSCLGSVRNWMANEADEPDSFSRVLYDSHGYAGLRHELRHGRGATLAVLPVNRDVIERATGVIVHSHYAVRQARLHYGPAAADKMIVVPFPRQRAGGDRGLARRLLGIEPGDLVVCSFGMLAPTKLNQRLLSAWLHSDLARDARCHLLFVGENHGGDYGQALTRQIAASGLGSRIRITGFVSAQSYADHLDAADMVVQLRTDSRGETSAAIFDALAHGRPLIVNTHGSADELPTQAVLAVSDRFDELELVDALESLRQDPQRRAELTAGALDLIGQHHPAKVALLYRDAIEHFVRRSPVAVERRLLADVRRKSSDPELSGPARQEWQRIMAANLPRVDRPQLYVDVTATARSGLHTGIERVVRGVLSALLALGQDRYRVEPVKLVGRRYVHATAYGLQVLGHRPVELPEREAQPRLGDILLGLDWVADDLPANTALLDAWRVRGVRMLFVVYDLLPVREPQWFPEGIAPMHARWLRCVGSHADGLLCISRCVADDLRRWYDGHPPVRHDALPLGYFYPGNDPASTRPTVGLPADATSVLARLAASPSFLMVGTVEPRKGHALVLEAFEQLWAAGVAATLVVIGRQGWMCEAVARRMRAHAQAGTGLIWMEQASDEFLELIFGRVRALVAASAGEGFGLPLVEAARHGLPVIARDIPVFREVSSAFASYFDGEDVSTLVAALRQASTTARPRLAADTPATPSLLSWQETTGRLYEMLLDPGHAQWLSPWRPRTRSAPE